ncbi:MAG: leucine-rich repeat protein, partial [Clostridia bacterium]|nr:leucine-rich repeat protein [Clostridia bacterium]
NLETVTIGTVDDEEDNPGLESVQRSAFIGCDSLTAVYYTGSLAQWARIEFAGSDGGTNPVEMSHKLYIRGEEPVHITAEDLAGVEKIGEAAFRSIDSLESAELPEGLKTIRLYAFHDCKNLKTVTIPLSVSLIENDAFTGCTSLTDVYYAGSAEDWSKIEMLYADEYFTGVNIHYAVSFDETEVSVEKDGTLQLTATLNPGYSADDLIWTSSDPEIASVSSSGLVTGKSLGTVTVTAKLGESGPSATCTVTVVNCLHSNTMQVPAKAATCTEPGNNEYTHCNDCGEDIGRTDTPALGHNYENVEYSSDDAQHWQVCSRCNEDSPKENHTFGAATYAWSADNSICTAKHTCAVCGREVSETVDSTSQEIPAACFTDGKIQYTATFTKPGFTTQTTEAPSGESATHDWGATAYVWSADNSTCTATRVCTRNADHKEEETVNAAVTTTATCTEAGIITYTARFENAAFEIQKKTVAVDALGHKDTDNDGVCNTCKKVVDEAKHNAYLIGKVRFSVKSGEVYKNSKVTVIAKASNVPDGYILAVFDGGKEVKRGDRTSVTYEINDPVAQDKTLTVKIIDAAGDVQKDGSGKEPTAKIEIKVKKGFFDIIIAFFKKLFGSNKVTIKP